MKPKRLFYTLVFAVSLLLIGFFAARLGHRTAHSSIAEVDALLKQRHFQGAALIAKGGKILFSKGYGFANEEHQIPNSPQTVFRIGSLTKQFTAIAILQLQEEEKLREDGKLREEEKLSVSDPIAKYLPDYPQGERITIHHLLSHTSGIPSITDFPNLSEIQRHPTTPLQTIDYFKDHPLSFQPGTNCDYSDSGYIVLGAIIEKVTGQPYADVIQKKILKPLDMGSTYYDQHSSIIPQRATGYVKDEQGKLSHASYLDMSFPHAAGSLATTVEDLYKLDRALKDLSLLSKKSHDLLFTPHGSSQEHHITYGYGFFLGPNNLELEQAGSDMIGHYGTIEGFRAASYRTLHDDLTIILLSNLENTDINALYLAITHILRSFCLHSFWRL